MPRLPAGERRKQLVEAAIRVMSREGVAAATTRAIVAEAGVPLGIFHYCFRSKEELLREVTETVVGREVTAAMAVAGHPGADLRETIRASLRAYWAVVEADPQEHLVLYELTQYALRQPELAGVAGRQYAHYLDSATRFLETSAASGFEWTLPLPVLARLTVTVLDGLTLNWLVDRDSAQALAVLDAFGEHLAALTRPAAARL